MKQAQDHRQKYRLKFIIATPLVVLLVIAGIIAITLYSFTPDYDAELKVKGLHMTEQLLKGKYFCMEDEKEMKYKMVFLPE